LNATENRNIFSLDLNVPSESLSVTVLGREFQVAGAEQQKARLANAVLANSSDNGVVGINGKVPLQWTDFTIVSYTCET